ncbi:MAG: Ig-like domain-containing protein [Prevotella sp.]|nr:Ig-like domain-containing protein [Prevotella sp.]
MRHYRHTILSLTLAIIMALVMTSCARMGSPDGGWFDETPPHVVSATPADKGTEVKERKVRIYFNEFVKIDNPSEKVVVSPPQMEMPEIKTRGKYITVALQDTLQANTTYTIDFSDAISDNNESNPLGNYTYSFSTGNTIDTLEVSGTVLNSEDLEPIKGILVGLYALPDSNAVTTQQPTDSTANTNALTPDSIPAPTFIRVSRTDSRGHFVIKGIAPGTYTIGALQDMDGNYRFSALSEVMSFSHEHITPSVFIDTRQDTIWADEIHIKDINRVKYNHYVPDNIVLRAFTHTTNNRYFIKADRTEADRFTLFFTAPVPNDTVALNRLGLNYTKERLPRLRGLNFNDHNAFAIEPSLKGDTVTYWLRDTALVNQDTLQIEMQTLVNDSVGMLTMTTDTLEILPKIPYERRMKLKGEEIKEWQKKMEKRRKRLKDDDEPLDTVMPQPRLQPKFNFQQNITPDASLSITFPYPMVKIEREAVHLYVMQDSLWYRAPFLFQPVTTSEIATEDSLPRNWEVISEWIPGAEYSFEIDTLAFEDIYGHTSEPYKTGLRVRQLDEFGSLFVNVRYDDNSAAATRKRGIKPVVLIQLLDSGDKPLRTQPVEDGTAEFYYLNGGTYYMRAIIDRNANGVWDTGNYLTDTQPEEVYYYNNVVEIKPKWDITKEWNLTALPLDRQKPDAIKKQKADKEKRIQNRNAQRAAEKGIPAPMQ